MGEDALARVGTQHAQRGAGPGVVRSVSSRLASASHSASIIATRLSTAATAVLHEKRRAALSLDTLFSQAAGAQVELDCKVRQWSLACGGLVELLPAAEEARGGGGSRAGSRRVSREGKGEVEFGRLEEVLRDPALRARMKQGKLKGWKRAIEKLLRCYQGEVDRLLDVSRSSLVLESPADIVRCLNLILDDPEVILCRVQNRLDPTYDSSVSAGYRDVGLNLQIKSAWTVRAGIDTHVCELQLLLREFAELKHAAGHKHYVEFRNMRGC